jgi:hypothetical protein
VEMAAALTFAKYLGAVAGAIGRGAGAEVGAAVKAGGHLNANGAVSQFGVYKIHVNGKLYKIGKADLGRVTQSSGLPTRLHQQVRKLEQAYGKGSVTSEVEVLGEITSSEAKAAEMSQLHAHHLETGEVPPGNIKSYKP